MDETQSFRLTGTTEIVKIPVQHLEGQDVVYWESIEQVFPGVKCVKSGDAVIPRCIKYFPGMVLDIVLSSDLEHLHVDSLAGTPSRISSVALNSNPAVGQADSPSGPSGEGQVVQGLRIALALDETLTDDIGRRVSLIGSSNSPSRAETPSKTALSFRDVVRLALKKANESDRLVQPQEITTQIARMIQLQEASDVRQERIEQLQKQLLDHQEDMKQLQKASNIKQEKMNQLQRQALDQQEEMMQLAQDHHEEIKQLQIQALGQLAMLQSRVQAVLTQTYELHEYPIPRLFVVLPQDSSRWDILNPFTHKFRLYFLCECGEHTKSASSKRKIPHHIHLAKHEGYDIARPSEFFQKYGAYVLTILKMLKFGIEVAGVAMPALSHLISAEIIDQATAGLQQLKDHIEPGVDQVISYIDRVSVDEGKAVERIGELTEDNEALEGADLRKLDTFLKSKDGDKVLGNLYRIVTVEGQVKWVCNDHYRENYQEKAAILFQDAVDTLGGTFDENIGCVEISLPSKVLADQFYSALLQAKFIHELKIKLNWETSYNDLKTLRDTLHRTNIAVLEISGCLSIGPTGDIANRGRRYDPIFQIMRHPSIQSFEILRIPTDLFKRSSPWPSDVNLSHLRRLKIDAIGNEDRELIETDLVKQKSLILRALKATNSNLTTLDLRGNRIGDDGVVALSNALMTNSTLTTLDLRSNSIGDDGAVALSEALMTNSTLTTLNLQSNSIWLKGFFALSEIPKSHSTLITLELRSNRIGDNGAMALSEAVKTKSTLTTLELQSNGIEDDGARDLADILKTNSTLTTLDLSYNSIGSDGSKALADVIKTNSVLTTLNLGHNSIESDGSKALAQALKTNSVLSNLNLESNSIGNDGGRMLAEALKTNSVLTTLNLCRNMIGSDGGKVLAEALKTNSALTILNLYNNSIADDGCRALAEALKTNLTLTTLDLSRNSIGDDGGNAMAKALKTNSILTTLNLERNSIGLNGGKALAEALKTNSVLTTLNLCDNSIGSDGSKALAETLKINSALTTLNLYNNLIGDDGGKALAEALKANTALTILNVGRNSIGSDGGKALAESLKTNSILSTLKLYNNSIGNNGGKALAEALKTNSTLTTLDLSNSSVGKDGGKALAEALKTNSTLTILDLGNSSIEDDGVKALAEALKTNSVLTILNLCNNSIGPNGGKALAEALKTNSTLTSLNLERNSIGDGGGKALAEALETNSALTTLYLERNSIEYYGVKALDEALETNSMVTVTGI